MNGCECCEWVIINSGNALWHIRYQVITWANAQLTIELDEGYLQLKPHSLVQVYSVVIWQQSNPKLTMVSLLTIQETVYFIEGADVMSGLYFMQLITTLAERKFDANLVDTMPGYLALLWYQ